MKMRNMISRAAMAATLFVAAMAATSNAAAQSNEPLRKVSVGALYITSDSGLFIAKDRGYFKEQGLDVELTRFVSGADSIALAATNRLDVGTGGPAPGLLNALQRGTGLKIVGSKVTLLKGFPSGQLLVRSDLVESGKVKSLGDLKGMKIAVNNIQSASLNYVARAVATGGLTKDDVSLVDLPFDQFIPALTRKAVDAVLVFSPLSEVITDKMKLARAFPEGGIDVTSTGDDASLLFYSPGFAKTDEAKRFMVAHLKGLRDYYDAIVLGKGDKTEICAIINAYTKNTPPRCEGTAMSGVDPNGVVSVKSLERYQKEWLEWGVMTQKVDVQKYVDTSYLEYAWSKLGKY